MGKAPEGSTLILAGVRIFFKHAEGIDRWMHSSPMPKLVRFVQPFRVFRQHRLVTDRQTDAGLVANPRYHSVRRESIERVNKVRRLYMYLPDVYVLL